MFIYPGCIGFFGSVDDDQKCSDFYTGNFEESALQAAKSFVLLGTQGAGKSQIMACGIKKEDKDSYFWINLRTVDMDTRISEFSSKVTKSKQPDVQKEVIDQWKNADFIDSVLVSAADELVEALINSKHRSHSLVIQKLSLETELSKYKLIDLLCLYYSGNYPNHLETIFKTYFLGTTASWNFYLLKAQGDESST